MRYDRQGRRCEIFNTNNKIGRKVRKKKENHTPENSFLPSFVFSEERECVQCRCLPKKKKGQRQGVKPCVGGICVFGGVMDGMDA